MDENTDSQAGSDNATSSKADEYVKPKSSAEEDATTSTSAPGEEGGAFECNICFEPSKNSVVTMCGHLFCWPCLSRWLEARGANAVCPVCKSAISRERCVPIYGRNADSQSDPRNSGASSSGADASSDVPRRPQGQREEPAPNPNTFFGAPFNLFPDMAAGGNGFNLSFGIGAFPFALFSTFNLGGNAGLAGPNGARRNGANADGQVPDILLSRAFLLLAFVFIFWMALL